MAAEFLDFMFEKNPDEKKFCSTFGKVLSSGQGRNNKELKLEFSWEGKNASGSRDRARRCHHIVVKNDLASKLQFAKKRPEKPLQTAVDHLLEQKVLTNEPRALFVMSAINLLMTIQDADTTFDNEKAYTDRAGVTGDQAHRPHLKCMLWIFLMYYAGLPYAGGQQPILLDLLGSKEGDKAKKSGKGGKVKKSGKGDKVEKTDISDSCGLFLEILPLIRAIAVGFLGDTLDDYDFVLAAFAKDGRGISKSVIDKIGYFGTIDYENWLQEYAVARTSDTCAAKVSDKAPFFNVFLGLQLFGIVFGEEGEETGQEKGCYKRMLNLPLHMENQRSLHAAPCYAWNKSAHNATT